MGQADLGDQTGGTLRGPLYWGSPLVPLSGGKGGLEGGREGGREGLVQVFLHPPFLPNFFKILTLYWKIGCLFLTFSSGR